MNTIEIDNREPALIKGYFSVLNNINVKIKNLDQGDFIIRDFDENILLIIERKTIDDLLSSVKDNRYLEQSERYTKMELPNSKIIYLIEGDYEKFNKNTSEFKTIYSCIFSLSYNKDFKVFFTKSINSTITLIEEYTNRLNENKNNSKFKVNLIKKQNVTTQNIDNYMLNLVPGIGLNTAEQILNYVNKSFYDFWELLKNSKINLNDVKVNDKKLSKKIIKNIYLYLKIQNKDT